MAIAVIIAFNRCQSLSIAWERCREDGRGVKSDEVGGGRKEVEKGVEKNDRVGSENVRRCQRSAEFRLNLEDAGLCRPQKTI